MRGVYSQKVYRNFGGFSPVQIFEFSALSQSAEHWGVMRELVYRKDK